MVLVAKEGCGKNLLSLWSRGLGACAEKVSLSFEHILLSPWAPEVLWAVLQIMTWFLMHRTQQQEEVLASRDSPLHFHAHLAPEAPCVWSHTGFFFFFLQVSGLVNWAVKISKQNKKDRRKFTLTKHVGNVYLCWFCLFKETNPVHGDRVSSV